MNVFEMKKKSKIWPLTKWVCYSPIKFSMHFYFHVLNNKISFAGSWKVFKRSFVHVTKIQLVSDQYHLVNVFEMNKNLELQANEKCRFRVSEVQFCCFFSKFVASSFSKTQFTCNHDCKVIQFTFIFMFLLFIHVMRMV